MLRSSTLVQSTCIYVVFGCIFSKGKQTYTPLCRHDNMVHAPSEPQRPAACGDARALRMREDALGRSRIASCSPELAAAARIAAYGRISGRGSEEERVEVGTA
jgi:hypothetical protein